MTKLDKKIGSHTVECEITNKYGGQVELEMKFYLETSFLKLPIGHCLEAVYDTKGGMSDGIEGSELAIFDFAFNSAFIDYIRKDAYQEEKVLKESIVWLLTMVAKEVYIDVITFGDYAYNLVDFKSSVFDFKMAGYKSMGGDYIETVPYIEVGR